MWILVRTVEEFKEGHVATERIVNIPYLLNSPNGELFLIIDLIFPRYSFFFSF